MKLHELEALVAKWQKIRRERASIRRPGELDLRDPEGDPLQDTLPR